MPSIIHIPYEFKILPDDLAHLVVMTLSEKELLSFIKQIEYEVCSTDFLISLKNWILEECAKENIT